MDLPDFKSWNDAFSYLNIKGGQALEFAEDLNPAITDVAEVGYSGPDGNWVKVQSFDLTREGLAEFKRRLPTLLQSVNPQAKAASWADTVRTSTAVYPMKDGTTAEVTTVSAADAGLTKAERDARRVGVQLLPVLGEITGARPISGITIAWPRQIFTVVDPKLETNRKTADHEVFHAYTLADHELQFKILDAIHEAGLDAEFDVLYDRAMNLWGDRYQEADPVLLQYLVEQEVMAEARAGNAELLGRGIKKIGPTVRKAVRIWEKNWAASHKGQSAEEVRLGQPNAVDLALRYQQRGGLREQMSGFEEEIDFSAFEETDAYDRFQVADPLEQTLSGRDLGATMMESDDKLKREKVIPLLKEPDGEFAQLDPEKDEELEQMTSMIQGDTAAAIAGKLLQMANGAVYDDQRNIIPIHEEKLEALAEIMDTNPGESLLVFYNFQHDKERILARFPQARDFTGPKDVEDWNAGKVEILLCHPASCGHGLNLQAGGHIIVWYGLTWSLELYQQANARLPRPGQKESVIIHHIVCLDILQDVSGIKDREGNTVSTSKALRSMAALYSLPELDDDAVQGLAEYLGVAESVRGYSSKMVQRKLESMERKYQKYN